MSAQNSGQNQYPLFPIWAYQFKCQEGGTTVEPSEQASEALFCLRCGSRQVSDPLTGIAELTLEKQRADF